MCEREYVGGQIDITWTCDCNQTIIIVIIQEVAIYVTLMEFQNVVNINIILFVWLAKKQSKMS